MAEDPERAPRFLLLGNGNYGEWSIRMEAELIWKGLWDMVFVEVDTDGKSDDDVKAELQKLVAKRSAKKMAEARAEIILRVERDQLVHTRERDPKLIWEALTRAHRARGLGTRMTLRRKLLTAKKGAENMSAWINRVKGMALDLEDIGIKVAEEDKILALTAGLDETYDAFVMSLDSTDSTGLDFDRVADHLLNEDLRRASSSKHRVAETALAAREGKLQTCYRCGREGHIRAFCTATPLRGKGAPEQTAESATLAVVEGNYAF